MANNLDILLENLIEARLTSISDDVDLIEESILNRSISVLLLERMDRADISALEAVFKNAEGVLEDYGKAVNSVNPTPKYLADLLKALNKNLEARKNEFNKAKESDDIRKIVKYKDSVSDAGILIVSALRTIRNSVAASSSLLKSLGDDAFQAAGDTPEESEGILGDFQNLVNQAVSDRSVGARLKPDVLEKFKSELLSKVEKASTGRGILGKFMSGIKNSRLKIDPDKLVASISLLTPEALQEFDAAIKKVDGAVQQASEVAEETSEELQADSAENENTDASEETPEGEETTPEVEEGQFYRYTTKSGKEGIYRVEKKNDNGSVQIRKVVFKDGGIKTGGPTFAVEADQLDDQLTDDEVKASFDAPDEQIESIVDDAESAEDVVNNLKDAAVDDLADAVSEPDRRTKISRDRGLEMFKGVTQTPAEAGLLYSTVRRVINNEVGYEMFESKQEVNTLDRWLTIAGIDKDKNET
jgi:hypothetical protein